MMVNCIVRIMLIIMMMMIDNVDKSNSTKIKDRNYSDKLIQLRVREIILELIFLFQGIKIKRAILYFLEMGQMCIIIVFQMVQGPIRSCQGSD